MFVISREINRIHSNLLKWRRIGRLELNGQEKLAGNGRRMKGSVIPVYDYKDVAYKNEPILGYKTGSKEIQELEKALEKVRSEEHDIPIVIGGKEKRCGEPRYQVIPHSHGDRLAKYYYADEETIKEAIKVALDARKDWDATSYDTRIKIWEKAANLMADKYRGELLATTMLGQSKNVFQAEIDAAAELIDFIRMHAQFLKTLLNYKPISVDKSVTLNSLVHRGMDGFVAAVSPFNFTAIGGNLAYTPALMGNVVLWKPSDTAVLSNWLIYKIMKEAGVPDGVVNFLPADGPTFGNTVTDSPDFAALNFTGSVPTYRKLYKMVGEKIEKYRNFPRLSGECGGKNYHFIHPSANCEMVVACTVRSAFEYCGQKCSACSRLYVPSSLWCDKIQKPLCEASSKLITGDICDYKTFLGAVIDDKSFARISEYLKYAKGNDKCTILLGGNAHGESGYFIEPTIIEVTDPCDRLLREEIFGPVLSVFVYEDSKLDETIKMVGDSNFGLTGSVFAEDEEFLKKVPQLFRATAGNFYINDKCTGSVVGQQPFGGDRWSGTNDKPGSPYYLLRWTSMMSIKETFVPQVDIYYPYMGIEKC